MYIFKKTSKKPLNAINNSELNKVSFIGSADVPGDKSISQRALIIGLASIRETVIQGILDSEDVYYTLKAIEALGAKVEINKKKKILTVKGVGLGNLKSPKKPIYMGNSGTGTRLLIGLVAGSNATVTFYGDESLSNRPMDRIINPLKKMGANFIFSEEKKLPITVIGARKKGITMPIKYKSPVASAQIKSAIILAGLTARGSTQIEEPCISRNYTEVMLKKCGVNINSKIIKKNINVVTVNGTSHLKNCNFNIPSDPSSALFIVVACLITKGSKVQIKNV
jgi:3-phosphoshikimate 1-carboxyvinyltransferase